MNGDIVRIEIHPSTVKEFGPTKYTPFTWFYLTPSQIDIMTSLTKRMRLSMAEIIRQAVHTYLKTFPEYNQSELGPNHEPQS